MNEDHRHGHHVDIRKASIFSIVSDASVDYSTINSEQTPHFTFKSSDSYARQHTRIELSGSKVEINREVISCANLKDRYNENNNNNEKTFKEKSIKYYKKYTKNHSFIAMILTLFPFINWCKNYSFRLSLMYDIISGLTLTLVQIPEALANGYLTGVGAQYGLYVAFFPGLIYSLLGTSHHMSIGTFSIMSVMASDVVLRVQDNMYDRDGNLTRTGDEFTSVEILTSLCLLCGLIQILMACLNLGALSLLLSDCMTSAFTSAAAVQVFTSYFPTLFDINIPRMKYSMFRIFKEWIELFADIKEINYISFGISIISLTILLLVRQLVEPLIKKRYNRKIPLPLDLIVVIVVTIISWALALSDRHSVDIIGNIPKGFPAPKWPRLEIFRHIIWDSIVISVVSYAVSVSMAKTFAKKNKYKIAANQELWAMGAANTISSCFNCYPCSSSLARSSLLDRMGAKTQLSNIIAIMALLFVILFFEPLLYHLPKCILSVIILATLKSMFLQSKQVKRYLKFSRVEGMTWIMTFSAVIVFDVDIGLLIAIGFQIIIIVIRIIKPYSAELGRLSDTELYVNIKHYSKAHELNGIKIFHFSCALIFLNCQTFKANVYRNVFNISGNDINVYTNDSIRCKTQIRTVIIDCSSMFYIDISGVETILQLIAEFKRFNINVLLASCHPSVVSALTKCKPLLATNAMYVSVHDAVIKSLTFNDVSVV